MYVFVCMSVNSICYRKSILELVSSSDDPLQVGNVFFICQIGYIIYVCVCACVTRTHTLHLFILKKLN